MSSEGLRSVLSLEHLQVITNDFASAAGLDNVIYVSALCSLQGVCKCVFVLSSLSFTILTSEDDLDSSLSSHNGDLGSRPGVVVVSIEMLRRHDVVGTSICLSSDEGNLGNGGLSISVEQLSSVLDDTSELLDGSWQEPWNVGERNKWDLESIAESHESSCLNRCINIEATSQNIWLIGNNTNNSSLNITESNDDILRILWHDLIEIIAINDVLDDMLHVIRLVRVKWDNIIQ